MGDLHNPYSARISPGDPASASLCTRRIAQLPGFTGGTRIPSDPASLLSGAHERAGRKAVLGIRRSVRSIPFSRFPNSLGSGTYAHHLVPVNRGVQPVVPYWLLYAVVLTILMPYLKSKQQVTKV
jgi:hypothetical protein